MTETVFEDAKKVHEQIENINAFVEATKENDFISVYSGDKFISVNKESRVGKAIIDFCEKALIQLNEQFENI